MAIINPLLDTALGNVLTTSYINLPITAGISPTGYWYYYTPAAANNVSLGASITPYKWGEQLPLAGGNLTMVMDGTFPLITESWDGANTLYHGGTVEWIGPGINDITNEQEDDAFFFSHQGTLSTAPDDDVFYWDRAYEPFAGIEWEYYQYHQHSPTSYAQYENGRQTQGGDGWIDPGDKAYAYMITTRVRVSSVNYASVLARIHTPSIGGAHNSHNDVTLPTVANRNYMPGGILRGIGERYHAFYIVASGADWEILSRTYTDASASFTAQVSLGVFDLADPLFDPAANQQSQYPVRASCGTSFGARIYFPVILNNAISGFDLEIWSFNSIDNIGSGSLVRQVLASGAAARPDCFCALLGTEALYVLFTDVPNGGTNLWKYNGTAWSDSGSFLTNASADPIRIHGFEFNSQDFRWYALLSGTASGGGTYTEPGLYSFELDDAFTGYAHLDYDATNNAFLERGPLTAGYLKYQPSQAQYIRVNDIEPKAIGADTTILNYAEPGNQWFNRKQVGFGGKDFYYSTITLRDGRRFAAGQVVDNPGNRGGPGSGDFLVSVYTTDLQNAVHLAAGTSGDDYLTGCFESTTQQRVWITGYLKGQVVPKGDIWIHGWCRNLSDGGNAMEWADMTTDADGNVYLVGSHDAGWLIVAKYDRNYNIIWQKRLGDDTSFSDIGLGIAVGNNSIYICGSTQETGQGSTDALIVKMTTSGDISWAKVYGTVSSDQASSICTVTKSTSEYVVVAVVSGTATTFLILDALGNIVEQNNVTNLVVNRVRPNQSTPTGGRFLFAGTNGSTAGRFGLCEIDNATRMVQWIRALTSGNTVIAQDVVNSDAAVSGLDAGYVVVGSDGTKGFVIKVEVDESAGVYNITTAWQKDFDNSGFSAVLSSVYTDATRYVYAVGVNSNSGIAPMGMQEGFMTAWATTNGTLQYQTVFGHDMDEQWTAVAWDYYKRNVIVAGWSESHSASRDAIFFRYDKNGFGTGIYNLTETGTAPYYYNQTVLAVNTNATVIGSLTAPIDSAGVLISAVYSAYVEESDYLPRDFDGAFGPNGLFSGIIAYFDLPKFQEFLNSTEYKDAVARGDQLIYISDPELIGGWYQFGTVGDGASDDGNIFGYDIIQHSNGLVYAIGQTSGDITKYNTGTSGVYDYLLIELDPDTGELEFYQNGGVRDEETYALTELGDGRIAYVGRTSGELGGVNTGGYDIFLGIFDPVTETSDYYSIGSGLDDAGLNVHDLGNNELAVVYFSLGSLTGTVNSGSQDLGVIKFNYSTDTWGTAYQTGSATSELYLQNGRPSALLSEQRIAITASSAGVFADDAVTYGFLDVVLAILDLTNGTWKKYQLGTTANEIASSATAAGDTVLIAGNQGGSFTDSIDAIFVEFDALPGVSARSSSV